MGKPKLVKIGERTETYDMKAHRLNTYEVWLDGSWLGVVERVITLEPYRPRKDGSYDYQRAILRWQVRGAPWVYPFDRRADAVDFLMRMAA